MTIPKCKRCKGNGYYEMILKPIHQRSSRGESQIVPCDATGCNKGEFDRDAYERSWRIGRYK